MAQKLLYPVVNGKKECGKCGEILPIENFTKSKGGYYSSKCKRCVNEYGKKYRSDKDRKQKMREYHKKYMSNRKNRDTKNEYIRKYRKKIKKRGSFRSFFLKFFHPVFIIQYPNLWNF